MQTNTLFTSSIGAWIMAFIYDRIEVMTGFEFRPLIYAALVVVLVGMYKGLYAKDKNTENEETK